jgi:hypothetical protein
MLISAMLKWGFLYGKHSKWFKNINASEETFGIK